MRIVQISDTHVTRRGGATNANLQRLVRFLNEDLRPDLVVHTGDVIALTPGIADDFAVARRLLDELDAPLRVIPGNHDVGESGAQPWMGFATSPQHMEAFRTVFGDGRWLELLDPGWAALGVSDELFGSGLPEEEEQWSWLAEAIAGAAGRRLVAFMHKPLWSPLPEGSSSEHPVAVEPDDARRLLGLFAPGQLRAVGSGHLHRYRWTVRDDVAQVWAPGTAFVVRTPQPSMSLPMDGLNQVGVVEYRLEGESVDVYFRSVPDVADLDLWEIPEIREEFVRLEEQFGTPAETLAAAGKSA